MTGFSERLTRGAAIAAVLLLAACSGQEAAAPAPMPDGAPPADVPTPGGGGSAIQLSALSEADMAAQPLTGELGCNFSTDTASPLLIAMGTVASREPAQGLVKVSGTVERITAPGGFDGMPKGAVFTGQDKTIRITLTGPAAGGGESPPSPATLTYERADGARLTLAGRWECGP